MKFSIYSFLGVPTAPFQPSFNILPCGWLSPNQEAAW